jgi:hypothetical protein
LFELVLARELDEVTGHEDRVREASGGVVHLGGVLVGAEDDPHGWALVFTGQVVSQVVQVEVHLPGIFVSEATQLEVDGY